MEQQYTKIVTGIMALLIVIMVAVLIWWNVSPAMIEPDTTYEEFDGYTAYVQAGGGGTNVTATSFTLDDNPDGVGNTNVSCFNASGGGGRSYPTFTLNDNVLTIGANEADSFTQVNVTYTSEKSSSGDSANDMFGTIMPLIVLLALIIVAGIIIAIVNKFGE